MDRRNQRSGGDAAVEAPEAAGSAMLHARLTRVVNADPWLAVGVSAAVGGVLGGLLLPRAARLTFIAALGYLARGAWQRESAFDIDDVLVKLDGQHASQR